MRYKSITSRLERITCKLTEEGSGFSAIKQYPGESEEALHQRASKQEEQNIRQYGYPGLVVVIRNFSGMEVKDVSKP